MCSTFLIGVRRGSCWPCRVCPAPHELALEPAPSGSGTCAFTVLVIGGALWLKRVLWSVGQKNCTTPPPTPGLPPDAGAPLASTLWPLLLLLRLLQGCPQPYPLDPLHVQQVRTIYFCLPPVLPRAPPPAPAPWRSLFLAPSSLFPAHSSSEYFHQVDVFGNSFPLPPQPCPPGH